MKRKQRRIAAALSIVIVAIPLAAFMPWSGTAEAERYSGEPTPIISPSPLLTLAPEPEEQEYIPDAAEVEALAKMLYGEARGIASDMEKAACVWCVLNRVDDPRFPDTVLELYERITPRGTPYIVAKAGFLLQAVIMPYDVISQQFVDNLKRLTEQCVLSLDLREREKALAHAAEPEQYSLNVDPATGEIVEGENEVADNE